MTFDPFPERRLVYARQEPRFHQCLSQSIRRRLSRAQTAPWRSYLLWNGNTRLFTAMVDLTKHVIRLTELSRVECRQRCHPPPQPTPPFIFHFCFLHFTITILFMH